MANVRRSNMSKRPRVIGTTKEAISRAERELMRNFPPSFSEWLLKNNGLSLDGVQIYPVLDDRDPRMTWDSIVRNFNERWAAWLENFDDWLGDFDSLLPFADFGTGDFYCFDYSQLSAQCEPPVVRWSHETGDVEPRGASFPEYQSRLLLGEFKYD